VEKAKFELGPKQLAWLEALESGEYRQGFSCLRYGDNKPYFCCLGVLCETMGIERRATTGEYVHGGFGSNGYLPRGVPGLIGLRDSRGELATAVAADGQLYGALTQLNDTAGWGFKQIAAYIRANPENVFTHAA
jgi:hypothetical protein